MAAHRARLYDAIIAHRGSYRQPAPGLGPPPTLTAPRRAVPLTLVPLLPACRSYAIIAATSTAASLVVRWCSTPSLPEIGDIWLTHPPPEPRLMQAGIMPCPSPRRLTPAP